MQQQPKKKRPTPPPGIKQFILATAIAATVFGWQSLAQDVPKLKKVSLQPKTLVLKNKPAMRYYPQAKPRPRPIAVTRSSR